MLNPTERLLLILALTAMSAVWLWANMKVRTEQWLKLLTIAGFLATGGTATVLLIREAWRLL